MLKFVCVLQAQQGDTHEGGVGCADTGRQAGKGDERGMGRKGTRHRRSGQEGMTTASLGCCHESILTKQMRTTSFELCAGEMGGSKGRQGLAWARFHQV